MRTARWLELTSAALLAGACLVVAPLEEVNQSAAAQPDAAAGSGGSAGVSGTGGGAGTGGSGASDAGVECSTNQQCIESNADEPFRCLDGRCVRLTTQQCPLARGRFDHPNAIFVGAFASFRQGALGKDDETWNYELAINELNAGQVGGLRGSDGFHPLALVLCHSGAPGDDVNRRRTEVLTAAAHLTDTVRVSAVIASLESGDLLEVFDRHGAQKGVFFLSPGPATTAMTTVNSQELLWHMLGLPADLAPVYKALLGTLENHVKPIFAVPDNQVRVALVTTDEPVEVELESAADDILVFNGRGLEENRSLGLYTDVTLPRNATAEEVAAAAQAVIAFRPHIVVSMAGTVFSMGRTAAFPQSGVLSQIEKGWDAPNRPYYILAPFNFPTAQSGIIPLIDLVSMQVSEPNMHRRFIGINVAGSEDGVLYNQYLARLKRLNAEATEGSENFYDAVYFTAFAIQAAGPRVQMFGTELEQGIRRLITGGAQFDVGPDDIQAVFDELGREEPNGRLRLYGTLGPPRFDQRYGARVDTGALYCFERQPNETLVLHPQVGYFDRDTVTPRLQVSRLFADKPLPCLAELNLPQP